MNTETRNQHELHSADESHPSCFSLAPWVVHHKLKHDPSAFLLYHFYLQYCDLNKKTPCYRSTETMCKLTGLSRNTYKKCRDELEKQGLIRVERPKSNSRDTVVVWLVNIWTEASKWKDIQDESLDTGTDQNLTMMNTRLDQNLTGLGQNLTYDRVKNQPLNKNHEIGTKKEGDVAAGKIAAKADRPLRDVSHFTERKVTSTEETGTLFEEQHEPKKDDEATVAAKLLYHSLFNKRKLMRKDISIAKWADTLRDFMSEWDVAYNELFEVLDWYCDHIGDEFVPEAYSASGFVEKYVKIRNQMNIHNRKRVKPKAGLFTENRRQEFVEHYLERKNGKH